MEKDCVTRMGAPMSQHEDICQSDFFYDIDWKRLERRQLPPPFKPQVVSAIIQSMEIDTFFNTLASPTTPRRNTRWTRSTSIGRSRASASA